MRTSSPHHKQHGLSLIETIITVAIFTVIVGVLISSVIVFYRSNGFTVEQAFAVNSARRGVEAMVRDIREAAYADNGDYPVLAVGTTTFMFYSDIDRDESVELVRFFLEDGLFKKGITNAAGTPPVYATTTDEVVTTVSDNVRNIQENVPIFEYFDDSGAVITNFENIADIAFVRVTLIVNVNPDRLPNEFFLRSSATLRNLKVNL